MSLYGHPGHSARLNPIDLVEPPECLDKRPKAPRLRCES